MAHKTAGNEHYKANNYGSAVEEYTKAIEFNVVDPAMAPIFSNRA